MITLNAKKFPNLFGFVIVVNSQNHTFQIGASANKTEIILSF